MHLYVDEIQVAFLELFECVCCISKKGGGEREKEKLNSPDLFQFQNGLKRGGWKKLENFRGGGEAGRQIQE